jgi:hypothetical protein
MFPLGALIGSFVMSTEVETSLDLTKRKQPEI